MNPIFALLNGMEVVAILAVILVLFGAKKLPELARGLGQGIKEFKKSSRAIHDELKEAMDVNVPPPPPSAGPSPSGTTKTQPAKSGMNGAERGPPGRPLPRPGANSKSCLPARPPRTS